MANVRKYSTNRLFASVLTVVFIALIFTIDIDKLFRFYTDIELTILIIFAGVVMPSTAFFGYSVRLSEDRIVYRYNMFCRKIFKISDLSHVLYQPTWRAVSSQAKSARSLHIVRQSGGWRETISLASGVFSERDLADIARRLRDIRPQIQLDAQAQALIEKYKADS